MVTTRSARKRDSSISAEGTTKKARTKRTLAKTKAANSEEATKILEHQYPRKKDQHGNNFTITVAPSATAGLLLQLDSDLTQGTLIRRPSKRNRSPYVADVWLDSKQREAIVHVPNLDMGGKCVPGATLLMKTARDRKGNPVGPDALNPKYNTPKCEFHTQLLLVDETSFGYECPTWVGAHPSLGERIAEQLICQHMSEAIKSLQLPPDDMLFPEVEWYKREVKNLAGTEMRADFLLHHKQPENTNAASIRPRIVEVKTVVDTDYAVDALPDRKKCVFISSNKLKEGYQRTAIFPWGESNQKGPNGEKVVSARAIKHIQELTRIVQGKRTGPNGERYDATVLFVVVRDDAKSFRPNHEACPSFAKHLKIAHDAGVQVLAQQVSWGKVAEDIGKCFRGPLLPIDWP